ncbi:MAG: hypothetical protein JSV71_00600 [Nitrospiraceae bacterium]|nr:MAG: hypothetical protein JSV71_00600 [Nitrospiraceae bacterium]
MGKRWSPDLSNSEVTPKELCLNRRIFMTVAASLALSGIAGEPLMVKSEAEAGEKLSTVKRDKHHLQWSMGVHYYF